ncbi:TonB-dependent receptor plug domain-containing protein, partial [Gemmatimonadota bacterium]
MEVVLGPGSALYGPNTANGVLHILTRSPLDPTSTGTTVSLAGGERSVFQGQFRTSFLVNRNLGVKLSGQYLRGNEWKYTDLGEAAARAAADASPASCQASIALRGYSSAEAAQACAKVGIRDFDLERYGLEARADYRFAEDGTAILTYGRTSSSGIELTGLGAGQTNDWIYQFYQARMNKGRLFAQAYLNTSSAGDSWLLRDGVPLIDESKLYVAQAQHGFSLFDDRQDFTYGIDYFGTRPDTKGSINGVYEDEDNMDEWGVYLQSKTALSPKLDLVLAGRMDDHSMLPEKVFSPRAALVFKPTEDQSLRVTYNRAFSTPTSLNFFLDISAGAAPNDQLAALGYTLRAFGTGPNGYSFQNPDGSLRGMKSPFNPGGAGQLLPADPGIMWQFALGVLQAQVAQGLLPVELAGLLPVLGALSPTSSDVGIMLLNASTNALTPLSSTTIPDVPGIRESYTETFEVGWQGILANKLRISADVYYTKKNDFISPLLLQNPLLLLNGNDVGAFITAPIVGAITQQLIGMGLDPAIAQQQAQAQAAALVPLLAEGIAQIPLGVAATDQIASQGADLIVTYRNVGDISFWGADLGFSWFLDDKFTLNGTYSHVENDWFLIDDGAPLSLNAPKEKATLGLAFRNPRTGFNAEARVRHTAQFPAESAGYVGTKCLENHAGGLFEEDCVEAATL